MDFMKFKGAVAAPSPAQPLTPVYSKPVIEGTRTGRISSPRNLPFL